MMVESRTSSGGADATVSLGAAADETCTIGSTQASGTLVSMEFPEESRSASLLSPGIDGSIDMRGSLVVDDMSGSGTTTAPWDEDTLDEPVLTTIGRDLKSIGMKLLYVLLPRKQNKRLLHDWDLWGPLLLTMTLAILLRSSEKDSTTKTEMFAGVFFIICVGSAIVTMNAKLLGAKLSFFQSVCVIGYCILPQVGVCILLKAIGAVANAHVVIRILLCTGGFAWSVIASLGFIDETVDPNRRALILYPVVLFYLVGPRAMLCQSIAVSPASCARRVVGIMCLV
eukprot:m.107488 g.107488  ORF g.107488 m.107488 type:complete len:284 (+) comp16928_c0_seq5:145-996(+)